MKSLIRFEGVCKSFAGQSIFVNLNYTFYAGHTYFIHGLNGCGKTVLLKLALGLIETDVGSVTIDPSLRPAGTQFPLDIGAIIDRPGFISDLSGVENLSYLASFRKLVGRREIDQVMKDVGLDPAVRKPVKKYSLGMKQRLAIAQAIMETPQALVLDEAFNGLDQEGKALLQKILRDYQSHGALIILTSHSEVDLESISCRRLHLDHSGLTEA